MCAWTNSASVLHRTAVTVTAADGTPGIKPAGDNRFLWRLDADQATAFANQIDQLAVPSRPAGSESSSAPPGGDPSEGLPRRIHRGFPARLAPTVSQPVMAAPVAAIRRGSLPLLTAGIAAGHDGSLDLRANRRDGQPIAPSRMSIIWSISSSLTVSAGMKRSESGRGALTSRPRAIAAVRNLHRGVALQVERQQQTLATHLATAMPLRQRHAAAPP